MKNKLIAIFLIAGMSISCNPGKKAAATASASNNPNSYSSSAIAHAPEDGKSYETAVVIREKSETAGVHAEYQWIREHYSNYKVLGQSLANRNKKSFDVITIEFADGSKQDIYFDISGFFGHL
jgi:hypothetical protein